MAPEAPGRLGREGLTADCCFFFIAFTVTPCVAGPTKCAVLHICTGQKRRRRAFRIEA